MLIPKSTPFPDLELGKIITIDTTHELHFKLQLKHASY